MIPSPSLAIDLVAENPILLGEIVIKGNAAGLVVDDQVVGDGDSGPVIDLDSVIGVAHALVTKIPGCIGTDQVEL